MSVRVRKQYYWIIAYMEEQPYLIYGGETIEQARSKAYETLANTNFTIKQYPTRNLQAASAAFRGKRLEETRSLKQATRRIKHTVRRKRRR